MSLDVIAAPAVDTPPAPEAPAPPRRRGPGMTFAWLGLVLLGFQNTRIADLSISDLIFFLALAAIWAQLLTGRTDTLATSSMRRSSPMLLISALIMLSAGTLTSLMSLDPIVSMLVVLRYAWVSIVWFWILRAVARDRTALYELITAVRITGLISAVAAVLGYAGILSQPDNLSGRQQAFFYHANGLAGFLVMCLPFFLLGIPTTWTKPDRPELWSRWVPSALIIFALATTGSITAAMGAVTSVVVIGLLLATRGRQRRRKRPNPVLIMMTTGVCIVGLIWMSQSDAGVFSRLTAFQSGDPYVEGSVSVRQQSITFVGSRFDQRLVLGAGFDRESATAEFIGTPVEQLTLNTAAKDTGGSGLHNMLFKMYWEGGGLATLGFVLIVGWSVRQAWLVKNASPGDPLRLVAIASIGSIIGLNVLAQFQPMGFERFYWLPMAFAGILWSVRGHELRAQRQAAGARPQQ
jgi:hypothetical protein